MMRRITLKKLSGSDLTFFSYHYWITSGAKQKGFNLDRAILVDQLYPALAEKLESGQRRFPIDLSVYGPNGAEKHNLQRKIVKEAKNWRLNGELIGDPESEPYRYNDLNKGDFALMEFGGELIPDSANVLLVGQQSEPEFHAALQERFSEEFSSRKGMIVLKPGNFEDVINKVVLDAAHPAYAFVQDTLIEDVLEGDAEATYEFQRRTAGRPMDQEELDQARKSAAARGRAGEELVNAWLEAQWDAGAISRFYWVAAENAVAPYDFEVVSVGQEPVYVVDVKSTAGEFGAKIHISGAELHEMACGSRPYRIYRVSGLDTDSPELWISEVMGEFASRVLQELSGLPKGVQVDGVSVSPTHLEFAEGPISLAFLVEPGESQ